MNEQILEQSRKLAARNYQYVLERDVLSNGKIVFIARNLELEGCKSQGYTEDEARTNLDLARVDYIYSLLEDGIVPPDPIASNETITGNSDHIMTYHVVVLDASNVNVETVPQESQIPLYQV
jgi:predicted RNase H-like HicB family nuclease